MQVFVPWIANGCTFGTIDTSWKPHTRRWMRLLERIALEEPDNFHEFLGYDKNQLLNVAEIMMDGIRHRGTFANGRTGSASQRIEWKKH